MTVLTVGGRDELRASAAAQVDRWETQMADALAVLWERQEGVVLARLTGTKARKGTRHWTFTGAAPEPVELKALDPSYVLDPARWLLEAVNAVRQLLTRLFTDVIGRVLGRFGVEADPGPNAQPPVSVEEVVAAVDRRVASVQRGVATAIEEVQKVIADADEDGEPMEVIADRVRDTYERRRPTWSQRIVSTNVVGAMNEASLSAAVAAGCQAKQWLAAHDSRVRPSHVAADGQVVAITDRFRLGGGSTGQPESSLFYPGDPAGQLAEVINCRCTLIFPLPELGEPAYDPAALGWKAFDPSQPRDEHGRWLRVGTHATRHADSLLTEGFSLKKASGEGAVFGKGVYVATDPAATELYSNIGETLDVELAADARVLTVTARHNAFEYGVMEDALRRAEAEGNADAVARWKATMKGPHAANTSDPAATAFRLAMRGMGYDALRLDVTGPATRHGVGGSQLVVYDPKKVRFSRPVAEGKAFNPWQPRHPMGSPKAGQWMDTGGVSGALSVPFKAPPAKPSSSSSWAPKNPWDKVPAGKPSGGQGGPGQPPLSGGSGWAAAPPKPLPRPSPPAPDPSLGPGGPTGDFAADQKRVDALQAKYMAARQDTKSLFASRSRPGKYTRERERQQQEIIDHFVNAPGVRADGEVLMLGGLPGAGKTSSLHDPQVQAELGVDLSAYVTANSDEVKAEMVKRGMVPHYPGLTPAESMTMIQKESHEIFQRLQRAAFSQRKNVAVDMTLRGADHWYDTGAAAKAGEPPPYRKTLLFVDVPVETALERAVARYEGGDRYVPLKFIAGLESSDPDYESEPARIFDRVKDKADRWVLVDNSGSGPRLVASGGREGRS